MREDEKIQCMPQGEEDPTEELLEAAEKACEIYDGAIKSTEALRQKYVAFCDFCVRTPISAPHEGASGSSC